MKVFDKLVFLVLLPLARTSAWVGYGYVIIHNPLPAKLREWVKKDVWIKKMSFHCSPAP